MSTTPYNKNYIPDLEKLPDPQTFHSVEGADVPIHKVGINKFEYNVCPPVWTELGHTAEVPAEISIYVDLPAGTKGINMSRLVRCTAEMFPYFVDLTEFRMEAYLSEMLKRVEANTVHFKARFKAAVAQPSLRSGLNGLQWYNVEFEASKATEGKPKYFTTVDFIYSSACPCSYELAKQATKERGVDAISHSQRSLCKVTIEHNGNLAPDEIVLMLREALTTEVQVMVKREDEQAFAELNGSHPKFVEDAARLVFDRLNNCPEVIDFVSVHEHWESLHGHNAVSVIRKHTTGGLK
jgi:GTP cyclohydrolase I